MRLPVKPPTAVSNPSSTTSEKLDLMCRHLRETFGGAAESHLGVFILGRLFQWLVVGLYTCSISLLPINRWILLMAPLQCEAS